MQEKWHENGKIHARIRRESEKNGCYFFLFISKEIFQPRILSFSLSHSTNHFSLVRFFAFQTKEKKIEKKIRKYCCEFFMCLDVCILPLLLQPYVYIVCLMHIQAFHSIIPCKNKRNVFSIFSGFSLLWTQHTRQKHSPKCLKTICRNANTISAVDWGSKKSAQCKNSYHNARKKIFFFFLDCRTEDTMTKDKTGQK